MIATNIEQSEHLLELGLDIKTADMCLCKTAQGSWILYGYVPGEYDAHTIPAWSLSALLNVMPSEESKWCTLMHAQDFYWCTFEKSDGTILKEFCSNNYTDAAYQMVCWLLEQGLIKKGGEE